MNGIRDLHENATRAMGSAGPVARIFFSFPDLFPSLLFLHGNNECDVMLERQLLGRHCRV